MKEFIIKNTVEPFLSYSGELAKKQKHFSNLTTTIILIAVILLIVIVIIAMAYTIDTLLVHACLIVMIVTNTIVIKYISFWNLNSILMLVIISVAQLVLLFIITRTQELIDKIRYKAEHKQNYINNN